MQASGSSSRQVGETGYTGDVRSSAANVKRCGGAYSQQSPCSGVDVVPETQMSSAAHRFQGLALSRSSDYEFGVGREVDMPVWSGVTPCGDQRNRVDETVRWEKAGDQSPVGRDTTHFVTVDETVISPIQRTSLDRTPHTRTKYPVQSTANSKTFGSSGNDSKEEKLLEMY